MVDKHQNKWMDHLPFILLGKRVALQEDLGASASELTFGMNVRIPGQILRDPGEEMPSEIQLQNLLNSVKMRTNNPPIPTSNHCVKEKPLPGLPEGTTHVYTKQHKTQGLQCPYEGPFKIVSRPSRSTVKLEVGVFKSGEKRYEIRHLNDLKAAHPDSLAKPVQRPTLGRPQSRLKPDANPAQQNPSNQLIVSPASAPVTPSESAGDPSPSVPSAPIVNKPLNVNNGEQRGKIQTPLRRQPQRSTRNPSPTYVNAFEFDHRPWSAKSDEIRRLNEAISRGSIGI